MVSAINDTLGNGLNSNVGTLTQVDDPALITTGEDMLSAINSLIDGIVSVDNTIKERKGGQELMNEIVKKTDNYSTYLSDTYNKLSNDVINEYSDKQSKDLMLSQTLAQNQNMKKLQNQVMSKNNADISKLNTDILTAKRVATINKQELIHTTVVCDYLRLCIIFFAIALIVTFLSSIKLVPHIIMEMLLITLGTILLIMIIYRLIMNSNHYNMLYQERVFPLHDGGQDEDDDCNCDNEVDDPEPEQIAQVVQTTEQSCPADSVTPSPPSP
tara:strand:+ start:2458 stop:3270 length:813 start_codon:yes stop_codon:yes gene_type:complete